MPELARNFIEGASLAIEIAGVVAVIAGLLWATVQYFVNFRHSGHAFETFRAHVGRGILVGLEFLVAADIIHTVAIELTWSNVGILALIILMRTFLSMTLSMEINRWLPWEKDLETRTKADRP